MLYVIAFLAFAVLGCTYAGLAAVAACPPDQVEVKLYVDGRDPEPGCADPAALVCPTGVLVGARVTADGTEALCEFPDGTP